MSKHHYSLDDNGTLRHFIDDELRATVAADGLHEYRASLAADGVVIPTDDEIRNALPDPNYPQITANTQRAAARAGYDWRRAAAGGSTDGQVLDYLKQNPRASAVTQAELDAQAAANSGVSQAELDARRDDTGSRDPLLGQRDPLHTPSTKGSKHG